MPHGSGPYAGVDDLDQLVIDAICMRLSAGTEVLARLDGNVRPRLPGDNWQFMRGCETASLMGI